MGAYAVFRCHKQLVCGSWASCRKKSLRFPEGFYFKVPATVPIQVPQGVVSDFVFFVACCLQGLWLRVGLYGLVLRDTLLQLLFRPWSLLFPTCSAREAQHMPNDTVPRMYCIPKGIQ